MADRESEATILLESGTCGAAPGLTVLASEIHIGAGARIEQIEIQRRSRDQAEALVELLQDTGARSFQMDVRGPWIAEGDFNNRFGLDLALKDVRLGCEMARAWGLDLKAMEAALELYKKASAEGFGKEDCNAVYKVVGS